ncbi:winged helix-turn-helix domain-containing protein [Chloroflexota bacterium]
MKEVCIEFDIDEQTRDNTILQGHLSIKGLSKLVPIDKLIDREYYSHGNKMGGGLRMEANRRRSNFEIIADMLKVGENGAGKTKIMYNANLSYRQIQKYLAFLLSQGFIDKMEMGNPSVTYKVTDSGLKLLKSINNITEMLGLDDEDGS